jgi:hypothetical protein
MEMINGAYMTDLVQARILHRQGHAADAQRIENLVRRRHLDAMLTTMQRRAVGIRVRL